MSENTQRSMMRNLPAVDRLLSETPLKEIAVRVPHAIIVQAARETLDELRGRIRDGSTIEPEDLTPLRIAERTADAALRLNTPSLRRVINATGVILHTGLGRAVLPEGARDAMMLVASGHSNLEIDLETGGRGSRRQHYAALLASLCGAEAALAVNNNAAAVLLALNTLARGREVVISRGQLVEIGGSFRLPDIMARSGARLVEVGTTNRTRIADYEAAITEETALILRVHPSNFRVVGYTEEASLEQLVELGRHHGIPVMEDVGSGALIDMTQFGLKGDPVVQESIEAGVDVVTFSGDKLLGGPQAGLIVGRREIVADLTANPLARVLRPDKLTIAALESTLKLYSDPDTVADNIPTLRFIKRPLEEINRAAQRLRRRLTQTLPVTVSVEILDGFSEVGGGSLPGQCLPTKLVAISSSQPETANPNDLARAFRKADPPILGRVAEDRFLLDLRTVADSEIPDIVRAARYIFQD